MMVIFLVGLVSMILMRTLRKDYARYSKEEEMDDMDRDLGDEYGWKQVHGDVFRPSSHPLIFSSLIGSGCQIFAVSLIVIIVAMIEDLYTERGSMLSTAIFVYAATSPVNGYFGGSLYARQGGRRWIKQMFIGAFLIPAMVCGTAFFINFIAIYYHASRAIPFGTMYQDKEEVVLWMNTVGPYHNRQETYKYFSLPFCVGSKKKVSVITMKLWEKHFKELNWNLVVWILNSKMM